MCSSDERISHHGRVLKSVSAHGARNVRLSAVVRSSLVRDSPTGIGDGLANCFIIGSTIILKMYCYSIKGKPYSLYGVEQSGMKARRVLLQNRSIEIYSWL